MNTADLLAAAKAARNIPSNYRLARELDVPEKTVSRWSQGRSRPDDEHARRLAELADLDPGYVIASIRAEREAEGPLRAVWEGIAERLQRAAAVVGLVVVGTFSSAPNNAQAASSPLGNGHVQPGEGLKIM